VRIIIELQDQTTPARITSSQGLAVVAAVGQARNAGSALQLARQESPRVGRSSAVRSERQQSMADPRRPWGAARFVPPSVRARLTPGLRRAGRVGQRNNGNFELRAPPRRDQAARLRDFLVGIAAAAIDAASASFAIRSLVLGTPMPVTMS